MSVWAKLAKISSREHFYLYSNCYTLLVSVFWILFSKYGNSFSRLCNTKWRSGEACQDLGMQALFFCFRDACSCLCAWWSIMVAIPFKVLVLSCNFFGYNFNLEQVFSKLFAQKKKKKKTKYQQVYRTPYFIIML